MGDLSQGMRANLGRAFLQNLGALSSGSMRFFARVSCSCFFFHVLLLHSFGSQPIFILTRQFFMLQRFWCSCGGAVFMT